MPPPPPFSLYQWLLMRINIVRMLVSRSWIFDIRVKKLQVRPVHKKFIFHSWIGYVIIDASGHFTAFAICLFVCLFVVIFILLLWCWWWWWWWWWWWILLLWWWWWFLLLLFSCCVTIACDMNFRWQRCERSTYQVYRITIRLPKSGVLRQQTLAPGPPELMAGLIPVIHPWTRAGEGRQI